MPGQVVPMIHVPDVRAAVDWYGDIGFNAHVTYGNEGDGLSFAILGYGSSRVMFNQGGHPSSAHRREVDLYIYADGIDDLYHRLKERVEVVEPPHDTFYGMRELIIRDLNRFWVTFGQSSTFDTLVTAARSGDIEALREALATRSASAEALISAHTAARLNDHAEIARLLEGAGAVAAPDVDQVLLETYAGRYRSEHGFEINVTARDGRLFAALSAQEPLSLLAIDETTFRPIYFDNFGSLSFVRDLDRVTGCVLSIHGHAREFTRVP